MHRLRSFLTYQSRYGFFRGTRLALDVYLASQRPPAGKLVRIRVPGVRSPISLRQRTTDANVFHQYFGVGLQFGVKEPVRFVIDAGANVGISSAYFSWRFPTAQVVALELEASNYSMLRVNAAAFPNIQALHKGLWWRPARLRVANPSARNWSYQAAEVPVDEADYVEAVTIGQLLREYPHEAVDLLKIDIEGAERELFSQGVEAWIDRVRVIAVEMHEWCAPGCGRAIRQAVLGRGFKESEEGEYRVFVRI